MSIRPIAGPSRRLILPCTRSHSTAHSRPTPSHAYAVSPLSSRPGPPPPPPPRTEATSSRPDLTPEQHDLIARIVRVDQAGELGANWIYRGQKWGSALRGDRKTVKEVEGMWASERHHLAVMKLVQQQHRVRPTLLYPLWQAMAFGLGAGTALMGREAAMACTEAVETVIGEHYDDQLRALKPLLESTASTAVSPTNPNANTVADAVAAPHPSLPLLASVLEEFRDDELEHLDIAVEGGAQKAPGHSLLSAVIGFGCKAAIKVCERV
ncbi:oxidoreductase with NADH or NADPH as one donor, and incorporation of one atom of oxygen into the other donor [Saitozyma sp. JCM 24511]|nr:oxidoreductase with NADH or NADPH as one donor, and incorporation of one atom of oxygen into the other donor [Saitozyma sp. JCM 24511]